MTQTLHSIKVPVLGVLLATFLLGFVVLGPSRALDLGDLLKVFGIGYAVQAFNKPINDFINKVLGEREAQAAGATKVVPILSVGQGGYIGAAQVVGNPDKVQTVQAVAQVETRFEDRFGMRVLLPISTKTVSGSPKGVSGTGVSAIIDFEI